jgi:hypothetical protein
MTDNLPQPIAPDDRRRIVQAINAMPYGASIAVDSRSIRTGADVAGYLHALARVLSSAGDNARRVELERNQLRGDVSALRRLIGAPELDAGTPYGSRDGSGIL